MRPQRELFWGYVFRGNYTQLPSNWCCVSGQRRPRGGSDRERPMRVGHAILRIGSVCRRHDLDSAGRALTTCQPIPTLRLPALFETRTATLEPWVIGLVTSLSGGSTPNDRTHVVVGILGGVLRVVGGHGPPVRLPRFQHQRDQSDRNPTRQLSSNHSPQDPDADAFQANAAGLIEANGITLSRVVSWDRPAG